eukprot:SAG31_NODE_1147_length_9665_cov_10.571399_8_plen_83_part_00
MSVPDSALLFVVIQRPSAVSQFLKLPRLRMLRCQSITGFMSVAVARAIAHRSTDWRPAVPNTAIISGAADAHCTINRRTRRL